MAIELSTGERDNPYAAIAMDATTWLWIDNMIVLDVLVCCGRMNKERKRRERRGCDSGSREIIKWARPWRCPSSFSISRNAERRV